MFTIGHAQDVSFKVSVMGTSVEPSVRLVLGCTPELSFPARKTVDGEWLSTVTIPTGISPCECDLRVEAVVNSKVFTPLVKRVELISLEEPVPPATLPELPPADELPFQVEPAELPALPLAVAREEVAAPPGIEQPEDTAPAAAPRVEYKKQASTPLGLLRRMAEATPVKVYTPVVTPLPKPGSTKSRPVKVSLSDISKMTETVKVTTKPTKPTKVLEIKSDIPTRLIKGPVVYE